MTEKQPANNKLLLQYLGFAFQLIVALGLSVFAGNWLDKQLNFTTPLLAWVLPLMTIVAMIIKAIKDTSKNKNEKK
jgi:membrane protein DedA with SNARE-associated domain